MDALQNVFNADSHISISSTYEVNIASMTKHLYRSDKNITKIPDGIVTKANGSPPSTWAPVLKGFSRLERPNSRNWTYVAQPGIHSFRVYTTSGAASPDVIEQVGMPRIRRAHELAVNKADPIIPDKLNKKFETAGESTNVLVALTKNKQEGSDLYHFLHQIEADIEDLNNQLKESDIILWVKEHQRTVEYVETDTGEFAEYDNIFRIEPEEGLSSVDILYMMDGLLTDISSIYVDSLLFDIPIGFINFDYYLEENKIFYPERPFWPGEKINNTDELRSFFRSFQSQRDEWSTDREYARKVLLGGETKKEVVDQDFWDKVLLK